MFKNFKLRTQLNFGFATVIALLVIVAGTAYWGLSGAFEDFTEYRRLARRSNEIASFQENTLSMELAFRGFMVKHNDESVQAYRERFDEVINNLKSLKESVKNPERAKLVAFLDDQIKKYDEMFGQVVTLEKKRSETIKGLVEIGTNIQGTMISILDAASKDNNVIVATLAGKLQIQFMDGRYLALRYVLTRNRQDYEKAQEAVITKVDAARFTDTGRETGIYAAMREMAGQLKEMVGQVFGHRPSELRRRRDRPRQRRPGAAHRRAGQRAGRDRLLDGRADLHGQAKRRARRASQPAGERRPQPSRAGRAGGGPSGDAP
jgi:CHASE3 domain sensor protein